MTTINQKEYLKKYLAIGSDPGKKKKRKKKSTPSDRVTIIDDDIDETFNQAVEEDLQGLNEDAPQIVGVIDERPLELRIDDYRKSDLWKPLGSNADSSEISAQSSQSFKQVESSGKTKKITIKVENDDYSPHRKRNNRSDDDYSPIRKSSKQNYDDDYSPIRKSSKPNYDDDYSPKRKSSKPNYVDDVSPIRRRRKNSTPSPNRRNTDYEISPIRRKKSSNTDFSPIRQNERYQSPNRKSASDDVSPPRRIKRESDSKIPRKGENERNSSPNRSSRYTSSSRSRRDLSPNKYSRSREGMHYKNSDRSRSRERMHYKNSDRSSRDISPSRRKREQSPYRNRRNSSPNRSRFDPSPRSSKNTSNRSQRDTSPNRSKWDSSPNKSKSRRELDSTRKSYQDGYRSPPRRSRRDSDSSPPRRIKYEKDQSPNRSQSRRNKSPERSPKDSYKRRDSPKRTNDENRSTIRKSRWDVDTDIPVIPLIPLIQVHKKSGLQRANELIQQNEFLRQNIEETASIAGNAAPIVRDRQTGKIRDFKREAEEAAKKQEKEDELKAKYDKWGKGLKQVEDATEQFKAELHEMNKPLARYADDEDLEKHLKEMERDGDPMLQYLRKKKRKDEIDSGKPLKPQFEGEFMPNRYGIRPGHRWDGVDRSSGYEKQWFEVMNSRRAQQEDAYKWSTEDM